MVTDRKAELEGLISTQGLSNTSVNREYNQLVGQSDAAATFFNQRSGGTPTPTAVPAPNEMTAPQPAQQAPNEINTQQAPNEINTRPAPVEPTPTTPTSTPKEVTVPNEAFKASDIASRAPTYQVGDKTYQTVRMKDGRLATIDTATGQAVTDFYDDSKRDQIKADLIKQGTKPLGEEEMFAQSKGIDYRKTSDGKIVYNPTDLNQALELYDRFGKNVAISKGSMEAIKGSAIFSKFSKYKGASTAEILNGLNSGELAVGGEAWNTITRFNGGVETPQMAEARAKFEKELRSNIDRQTNDAIFKVFNGEDTTMGSIVQEFNEIRQNLDKNYIEQQQKFLGEMANAWNEYKEGNQEANAAREKMNEVGAKIDKLNEDKFLKIDEIRARYPGVSEAVIMRLAKREMGEIDKELYGLQREYQLAQSDYQYFDTQNKAEFEFKMQLAQTEMGFMKEMYGTKRDDLGRLEQTAMSMQIRKEDIERQDKLLAQEREQKEMEYQRAIERADFEFARKVQTDIAMLQFQQQLNNDIGIKALGGDAFAVLNKQTGEWEFKSGSDLKGTSTSGGFGLGDMRNLASQFPNQAWAKNNNPAGITWNANFDNPKPGTTAQRLIDAGIKFEKGTARPASEGGNYVTFATMEDGLAAQRIMMQGTYGKSTVSQMLQSWVGTSEGPNYAKQVAGNAGIELNRKVSDLSDAELSQLQMAKIQKESPGLFKILSEQQSQTSFNPYMEDVFSANIKNPNATKMAEALGTTPAIATQLYNEWRVQDIAKSELGTDEFDFFVRATSVLPTRLRDSDADADRLMQGTKEHMRQGLTAFESADVFLGFDIRDMGDKELARTLRAPTYKLGDSFNPQGLARLLEEGNLREAVRTVETSLMDNYSDLKRDNAAQFASKKGNDIISNIEANLNKLGIVEGNFAKQAKKFREDSATTKIEADMIALVSQWRNEMIGANATVQELEMISGLVPAIKDNPFNAITKIKQFQSMQLDFLNAERITYGIPTLDMQSLTNWDKRVEKYKQEAQRQTPTQSSTGGSSFLNEIKQSSNLKINF